MQNNRLNYLSYTKLLSFFVHLLCALLAFFGIGILLIGVYHTAIALIAYAWSPLFLFVVPTLTLLLCGGVIFSNHPVHSLLCLITVFFSTVTLYLYVGAEFLAFLFLIVYVGAIAILFLFVIMLLHLKPLVGPKLRLSLRTVGLIVLVYCLGLEDILANSLTQLFASHTTNSVSNSAVSTEALVWFVNSRFSDILAFSNLLYTYHCFLFFISALLLLTAMLGAIILATSATDAEGKKKNRFKISKNMNIEKSRNLLK